MKLAVSKERIYTFIDYGVKKNEEQMESWK